MTRRSRTMVAVALMATTLLAGVAIGFVLGRSTQTTPSADEGDRRPPPGFRGRRLLERFKKRLSLDAEQAAKIGAIIEEARKASTAIHDQVRPTLRAIRERSRSQIRALLSEEQAVEYDKLIAEIEERRRHRPRGKERDPSKRWAAIDANGDGAVTRAECEASEERLARMCVRRFEELDTDKDGSLSEEERAAARDKRRHRPPPGPPI